jgi:polysaccharide biosynthesis/export protein
MIVYMKTLYMAGCKTGRLLQLLLGAGMLGLLCGLTACQTTPPASIDNSSMNVVDAGIPRRSPILVEGDVIQVAFAVSTNLNSIQRIQLDGDIFLQFIGKVKAAGMTPLDLEKTLAKLYEPQLRSPEPITVTIMSNAAAVYVTGAVLRPGKIPLDRPFTILDAIVEAGGVDHSRAKLSAVTVLRIEDGQRISRRINLKRALDGKDTSLFYLKPYDIVYVPEKVINF